jgi:methylase of polypeptide subunit release factors
MAVPLLPDGPAPLRDPRTVRDALDRAGYRVAQLSDLLGVRDELSARAADLVVYERRLAAAPGALADVVALFALSWPVPADRVVASLGGTAVTVLSDAGVLVETDGGLSATVRVMPHGDLWIASDRRPDDGEPADPGHVTGINPPAGLLANLTVRRPIGSALDVGTGNGIQALLAAGHAQRVVATDVNPRALAFTRFNAALNGVATIECRGGSVFEPVAGERFDLVVCNPPYVISPETEFVYRDSGAEPGALCRAVVSGVPDHLTDGGYATVLVSWPSDPDGDWSDVPRSWLAPGADAWLLHSRAEDPLTHAAKWNRPLAEEDAGAYAEALDRWTAYDDDRGIRQVSFGAIVLRAAAAAPGFVRSDDLPARVTAAGPQIERVFAAQHDLLANGSADVLGRRFRLAPGHRLEQHLACVDGEWQLLAAELALDEGIEFRGTLDGLMVQVLVAMDGSRTVHEAAAVAARASALPAQEWPALEESAATMAAGLYSLGLLEPAS